MSAWPTRAQTEVRGPDEYEEVDWDSSWGLERKYHSPKTCGPVISAGLCPRCGEVNCGPAYKRWPGIPGYRCDYRPTNIEEQP